MLSKRISPSRIVVALAAVFAVLALLMSMSIEPAKAKAKAGLGGGPVSLGGGPAKKATKYCTGIEGDKKVKAKQVIEARAKTTSTGYVYLCKKSGSRYVLDKGPYKAKFGYNGVTAKKKEGDGKTPKGVFTMRAGFGTSGNPGLSTQKWTKVTKDHVWVDGNASKAKGYNTMKRKSDGYKGEALYQPKPYKSAQVIGYNEARTAGKGSAIFLHANTNSMKTAGCVSMYQASLVKAMKWQKSKDVQIKIH